jgi:hypothetical protein
MSFNKDALPSPLTYCSEEGIQLEGSGIWRSAWCEFHEGRALRINTKTGAWVCMNCGEKGGDVLSFHMRRYHADFVEACKGLGAWTYDGKGEAFKPTPLPARAALQVLGFESELVAVAAGNVAHGVQLTTTDRDRVMLAAGRINRIAGAFA